jgi:hypothetical protein
MIPQPRRTAPVGMPTRGTTNPNRLRRVDSWLCSVYGLRLRACDDPLVVDLGFGASPATVVELRSRLRRVRSDVRVVGVEIDPERVAGAVAATDAPWLEFRRGGFDLAGLRPAIVRAFNVLRQYPESAVANAWATVAARLAPDGLLIDGTCDEAGRLAAWLSITPAAAPVALTLAADLASLPRPSSFAARLPKALIHHNTPGEGIHGLLVALDQAWQRAGPAFGARQRFVRAVQATREQGWPIQRQPRRWGQGELSIAWSAVAPAAAHRVAA